MEIWDLYDEHRNMTGKTHVRGEPIPDGYYHLLVEAWIRNSRGEYLISQRDASRPMFPLQWECVGGSALAGEDSITAVLREIKEEVGLSLRPENGVLEFSVTGRMVRGRRFHDILDVYVFRYDGDVDLSRADSGEVAQTRWMTVPEIRELYDAGEMVYTLGYFFEEIAE